jgi:metal-responsive CopG/Arc/MetJ family transcriptional regulator
MATGLRRFTISITPEIEYDLDIIKKEYFYKSNRNEMIRTLIVKGLDSLRAENQFNPITEGEKNYEK